MNEYNEIINKNKIVIFYFDGSTCGACEIIKEKILDIINEYNEIKFVEIDGVKYSNIAAQYNVFSLPITILFVNGKETIRFGRYVDMLEFKDIVNRYYGLIYS